MDIGALSMALSNQNLASAVSMSVMKLNMDTATQLNTDIVQNLKALELSVSPNLGSNIDISI